MSALSRPSRRQTLAVAMTGALAGCSADSSTGTPSLTGSPTTAPSATSKPGSATSPPTDTPGQTKGWVSAENLKPGSPHWRVGPSITAGEFDLAGYADRSSARPGDQVTLFVSSALGPVRVTAYRLGWYAGVGGREVASVDLGDVGEQPAPVTESGKMVRARWDPSGVLDTTGWPEGTYVLRLDASGKAKLIPLTIRSGETRDRLVVVNAVATYQAYNTWGGYSLYKGPAADPNSRATRVSFDRPYDGNGAAVLFKHEIDAISWIEKQGADLAYVTSLDLDADPALLDGARAVLSLGHDEYWSVAMRDHVEAARDRGTNLAFLGANACYWRVRFVASELGDRRIMLCSKDAQQDPGQDAESTTLWRSSPSARPENSLTGMLYELFPASAAMVVLDPDHFLFAGADLTRGDSFPGLVGTEIDRAYPIDGTPATLQVVCHSPVAIANRPSTFADVTYYTAKSGAGVVALGSMTFTRALAGADPRFGITAASSDLARLMVGNLIGALNVGPMVSHFPARPNLAALGAPSATSTGTGGPVG